MNRSAVAAVGLAGAFLVFQISWLNRSKAQGSPTPTLSPVASLTPGDGRVASLARLEPDGKVVALAAPADLAQERVLRWNVKEGQAVRRGQLLAILDAQDRLTRELQISESKVEVSASKVAMAQAKLEQVLAGAKSGEKRAQSIDIGRLVLDRLGSLEVQKAAIGRTAADVKLQKKEYERYLMLYREGASPASVLDQKKFALENSQIQLEQNRAEYDRLKKVLAAQARSAEARLEQIREIRPTDVSYAEAELGSARAELKASQADVERAKTLLQKCEIRSPQDGVVLKILTLTGEKIASGGLAQIGQTRRMVAVAEVYDSQILKVHTGQKVEFQGRALNKQKIRGEVYLIGNQVEKQNVFSNEPGENFDRRIIEVRVRLDEESSKIVAGLTNLQLEAIFQ